MKEIPERTMALLYGPAMEIESGSRIEDFVEPGYLVLVEGHWQRVKRVISSKAPQGSMLITDYGARVSLDGPPPPSFRYREPSNLPVADLAAKSVDLATQGLLLGRKGIILGFLALLASLVAAWASVYALFKSPPQETSTVPPSAAEAAPRSPDRQHGPTSETRPPPPGGLPARSSPAASTP